MGMTKSLLKFILSKLKICPSKAFSLEGVTLDNMNRMVCSKSDLSMPVAMVSL